MTSKEFNKEVKRICTKYDCTIESYETYIMETPFGRLSIRGNPSPKIKVYSIFMRFMEDFDISYFCRYFNDYEVINSYSKKWNLHNSDPQYILIELEERLDNLSYIFYRDGKVCGTEYKPFLNEIEL